MVRQELVLRQATVASRELRQDRIVLFLLICRLKLLRFDTPFNHPDARNSVKERKMSTKIMAAAILLLMCCVVTYRDAHASGPMFRCEQQGRIEVTDRPTHPSCQPLEVSPINRAESTRAASAAATSSTTPRSERNAKSDSIATAQIEHEKQCNRIRLRLSEIVNKERAGYTLQQGERLKERKRVLNEQLKIEGCR
jgi:hypothetical protein